jgi:hypothetical protein
MILLQVLIIAILLGIIRGGRPTPRGRLPVRWPALPLICLVAQFVAIRLGGPRTGGFDLPAGILLVSNLALLLMVWINRRVPGMRWLGLGLLLNLTVMLANGGYMPIAPETLARIGGQALATAPPGTRLLGYKDIVLPREQTWLGILSDVLVLPPPFAANAFSLGDASIAVGLFVFVQRVLLPVTTAGPRELTASSPAAPARSARHERDRVPLHTGEVAGHAPR